MTRCDRHKDQCISLQCSDVPKGYWAACPCTKRFQVTLAFETLCLHFVAPCPILMSADNVLATVSLPAFSSPSFRVLIFPNFSKIPSLSLLEFYLKEAVAGSACRPVGHGVVTHVHFMCVGVWAGS